MSFDLIDDVFEPVFQCVQSESPYLSHFRPPHRAKDNAGLEENWFHPKVVVPVLRQVGHDILDQPRDGVDILFRKNDLELELKAGNSLRAPYFAGTENNGWQTKYEHRPRLAGCLFLGGEYDAQVEDRLNKIVENASRGISLGKYGEFKDEAGSSWTWVVGLLVTPSVGASLLNESR
jgi:hypothetical protein